MANILQDMQTLVRIFSMHCEDSETFVQIGTMIENRGSWPDARSLFDAIRAKNLKASKSGDSRAEAQYCFEEVCAKTLYNLSMKSAPYDPDTPYWIIPNAFSLAKKLGIPPIDVIQILDQSLTL